MKCEVCDMELEEGGIFCPNCGTRVVRTSSAGAATVMLPSNQAPTASPPPYVSETPPAYTPPVSQPTLLAPQQPYAPSPFYSASVAPTTSTAAVISLIMGILSWCGLVFIGTFGAIIAGHMARREIQNSNGQVSGNGLALAGLILGYLNLALLLLMCAAFCFLVWLGAALE
jgi:hypothetical protein